MEHLSDRGVDLLKDSVMDFQQDVDGMIEQLHRIAEVEMGNDREGFFMILNAMRDMVDGMISESNNIYDTEPFNG